MKNINNSLKRLLKKSPFEFAVIAFMFAIILYGVVPMDVLADDASNIAHPEKTIQMEIEAMQNKTKKFGVLPESDLRDPLKTMGNIAVSAYNSVPWQTDATPCIGAQGTDICAYLDAGSNTCAANFVPLGTILEVEGLGTCVVRDRMNARYYYRVDWYMGMDVTAARQFGVRYKKIGIYPS